MVWAPTSPKAALDAGYKVVATGRNTDRVVQTVGPSESLLVVKLDVTNPSDGIVRVLDILVHSCGAIRPPQRQSLPDKSTATGNAIFASRISLAISSLKTEIPSGFMR